MSKLSAYAALGALVDSDYLLALDVSDTSMAATGTDKKMLASVLKTYVKSGPVSAQANPGNPASTTSASLVMMGLGSTCKITPGSSGKTFVSITGGAATLVAAVIGNVGVRYGTGTAPVNGAAVTGTRWAGVGDKQFKSSGVATTEDSLAFTDLLTLTPATAYWFDIALSTTNAADAAEVLNISFVAYEIS